MKKAKLFLAAIAVMGIVGGAFAFKAKMFNPTFTYYVSTTTAVIPTSTITDAYTVLGTDNYVTAEYFTTQSGKKATTFGYITTTTGLE